MPDQQLQPLSFEHINWEKQEKETIIPKIEVLAAILVNYTTALQSLRVVSGNNKEFDQAMHALEQTRQPYEQAKQTYFQAFEQTEQAEQALKKAIFQARQTNEQATQANQTYKQAEHTANQALEKAKQAYFQAMHALEQAYKDLPTYKAYEQANQAYRANNYSAQSIDIFGIREKTYNRIKETVNQTYKAHEQAKEAYKDLPIYKAYEQAKQTYYQAEEAYKQTHEQANQAYNQAHEQSNQAFQAFQQTDKAYNQAKEALEQAEQALKKTLEQLDPIVKALEDKDYTKNEPPQIRGIATTLKRFSDTFTQANRPRTKEEILTEYDRAPRLPTDKTKVRTYEAEVIEAIKDVLNKERQKQPHTITPQQIAAYEEKTIKNVKYLCNGMRGLLNTLIDFNDGKSIADDFRRGELRGLATLGLNPDQVRKLYPQREKMHKLINEFEDHTIESIFLS